MRRFWRSRDFSRFVSMTLTEAASSPSSSSECTLIGVISPVSATSCTALERSRMGRMVLLAAHSPVSVVAMTPTAPATMRMIHNDCSTPYVVSNGSPMTRA